MLLHVRNVFTFLIWRVANLNVCDQLWNCIHRKGGSCIRKQIVQEIYTEKVPVSWITQIYYIWMCSPFTNIFISVVIVSKSFLILAYISQCSNFWCNFIEKVKSGSYGTFLSFPIHFFHLFFEINVRNFYISTHLSCSTGELWTTFPA